MSRTCVICSADAVRWSVNGNGYCGQHWHAAPCLGCGHSRARHINGRGLCLVASCRLCLIYRVGVIA